MGNAKNTDLWVQGQTMSGTRSVSLEQGWVPFAVRARLGEASTLKLLISDSQSQPEEMPTARLWPQPPSAGLAVTVARDGTTLSHRIDPYVGSSVWSPGSGTLGGILPAPASRDPIFIPLAPDDATLIHWQGELYTDGGTYTLNLRTDGLASMALDGRTVFSLCTPRNAYPPKGGDLGHDAKVTLSPGWHAVDLKLSTGGNSNGLELSWARPDGVREIIPASRFRFAPGLNSAVTWPSPHGGPDCPAK